MRNTTPRGNVQRIRM